MLPHAILLLLLCASLADAICMCCIDAESTSSGAYLGGTTNMKMPLGCPNNGRVMHKSKLYESVWCVVFRGWKGTVRDETGQLTEEAIVDTSERKTFLCQESPGIPTLTVAPPAPYKGPCWGTYDSTLSNAEHGGLFCLQDGRFPKAIIFNSIAYESVACNEVLGWNGIKRVYEGGQWIRKDHYIGKTYSSPHLSCVEYCVYTGAGVEIVNNYGSPDAFCTEQDLQVFYGTRPLRRAWCALEIGWTDEYGALITKDTSTPLQLECRKEGEAPRSTTTPAPKTPETPLITRIPIIPQTSSTPEITTTTTLPPAVTVQEKKPNDSESAASKDEAPGVSTATIIGCSIGGIILVVIAGVVIFCLVKKRQNEDGRESKEGGRTKEYNDEILDETNVESTSEVNV